MNVVITGDRKSTSGKEVGRGGYVICVQMKEKGKRKGKRN